MGDRSGAHQPAAAQLGVWDTISLMVGIVIGASVYETPPAILLQMPGPWTGLGVWALGGLLTLVGALCYAELASTYPLLGGDYVYLSRAFGPWAGYLFGWGQLAVVRTANIGMMAFIFARYALRLWHLPDESAAAVAGSAVVLLTAVNVLGVVAGKGTQNVLTAAKVLGLLGIVAAGLGWGQPGGWQPAPVPAEASGFGLAMIYVLFAYGGWNDAALVAAELRQPRHITRALLLGTAAVTAIYLAVNAAYVFGLGFDGVRASRAVAAELLAKPLGGLGENAMCVLVMLSALGAINGLVYTGARVFAAMGAEHAAFGLLGRWYPGLRTPLWALLAQAVVSLIMIGVVGTAGGHRLIDHELEDLGLSPLPWRGYGGFETLLVGTAPVFWFFFLLTGVAQFALRRKEPDRVRPFALAAPWYPLLPLVFCGTCIFMLYSALVYAGWLALLGFVPLALGLPLYYCTPGGGAPRAEPAEALAARQ